ncbi:Hsp70 family protein [Pseudomonas sp.]|uniref:Hsp70 family protein n=1 Tax=Pseudomonas sp. TaxID=306 RepID=UPI003D0EEFEA
MKIGVDFGTSYTCAAALVGGQVVHINFDSGDQFSTVVFFPEQPVDMSKFALTDKDEHEITSYVRTQRSIQSQSVQRNLKLKVDMLKEERQRADAGKPFTIDEIETRRLRLQKTVVLSDDELRNVAVAAIKRDWIREQTVLVRTQNLRTDTALFGDDALESLFTFGEGRLFQSIKSMLGFRLATQHVTLISDVVSRILRHVRETASKQLGVNVTHATIGRPVMFRGQLGEQSDEQPLAMLQRAARDAGFEEVDFLEEPIAAAIGYHTSSPGKHLALIVDIGGGTTDLALAEIGGGDSLPRILRTWGTPHGGTDVDVALSMRVAMPVFGKGEGPILDPVYRSAALVSDLNRQKEFRDSDARHLMEPFRSRYEALKKSGATNLLGQDVERLKVELSAAEECSRGLKYIENNLIISATREDLEQGADRFMLYIEQLLKTAAGQGAAEAAAIFLTGGMSRAPYVQACVQKVFPGVSLVHGDPSLGVVSGLAAFAATPPGQAIQSENGEQGLQAAIEDVLPHEFTDDLLQRIRRHADFLGVSLDTMLQALSDHHRAGLKGRSVKFIDALNEVRQSEGLSASE